MFSILISISIVNQQPSSPAFTTSFNFAIMKTSFILMGLATATSAFAAISEGVSENTIYILTRHLSLVLVLFISFSSACN